MMDSVQSVQFKTAYQERPTTGIISFKIHKRQLIRINEILQANFFFSLSEFVRTSIFLFFDEPNFFLTEKLNDKFSGNNYAKTKICVKFTDEFRDFINKYVKMTLEFETNSQFFRHCVDIGIEKYRALIKEGESVIWGRKLS